MASELSTVIGELVEEKTITPTQEIICGGVAGLIADCFTHPFDTLRCRMQVLVGTQRRSLLATLRSSISSEGMGVLYRGFGVVAVGTIPAHALYFGGYEMTKRHLAQYIDTSSSFQVASSHFAAGLVAELGGALVWNPMDVVKQRVMVRDSASGLVDYQSSLRGVRTVLQKEGLRGFYHGFGPALAVYGPFVGVYFTAYEEFKAAFARTLQVDPSSLSSLVHLPCGFAAGGLAAALTCPLDVIKTRVQVASRNPHGQSAWQLAKDIHRNEGKAAFLKGISARVLWIAPASAITIASYELLKNLFVPS